MSNPDRSSPPLSPPAQPASKGLTYRDAGVDISAGNQLVERIKPLVARTRRPGSTPALGGFGGLFDLAHTGYQDPVLVAANDGVGTKLKLAIDMDRHDTIGIDLVAMCVNDLIVQGAEPLFFLDYFACGQLDTNRAEQVIAGIAKGCTLAGAALIGGETAEMPGVYQAQDYDLAGFAVGAVERDRILPRTTVQPGDVILGLASSGVHSNGFSLVRKLIEQAGVTLDAAAPWLTHAAPSLGEALLTPTRIYVKSLLALLRHYETASADPVTTPVRAFAHITGGGLTENLPRVLPDGMAARIDLARLSPSGELPAALTSCFSWLAQTGRISQPEMLRTFNCGVGMALIVQADAADDIAGLLRAQGEQVIAIGEIIEQGPAANNAANNEDGGKAGDPVRYSGTLGYGKH